MKFNQEEKSGFGMIQPKNKWDKERILLRKMGYQLRLWYMTHMGHKTLLLRV